MKQKIGLGVYFLILFFLEKVDFFLCLDVKYLAFNVKGRNKIKNSFLVAHDVFMDIGTALLPRYDVIVTFAPNFKAVVPFKLNPLNSSY